MGLSTFLKDVKIVPDSVLGIRNRAQFEKDLENYRQRYAILSFLIFLCVLLVVAIAGYTAFHFKDDPSKLGLLSGATGITLIGAIELLRRVAREWGRIDLLLIWLKNADDEDVPKIINGLKVTMKDPSSASRTR